MASVEERIQAKMAEIKATEARKKAKDAARLLEEAIEREAIRRIAKEKAIKHQEKTQLIENKLKERNRIKEEHNARCTNAVKDTFFAYWSTQPEMYNTLDEKRNILSELGISKENITTYLPDKIARNEYYISRIFNGPPEITVNEHYRLFGYQSAHSIYSPMSQWT